jgi:hypothetical protein
MATWRYVDFSKPEAQRLADLSGIRYDLQSVQEYCELFLAREFPGSSIEESRLMTALCVSAIVSYGRTLATGVRSGISKEQIERLPHELQERHTFFKDVRDKFIAHSVNAFEDNSVKVYLVPEERGGREISSVSVQHGRVMMLSPADMESLNDLAVALVGIVDADADAEKKEVLAYARSLPIDPFYEAEAGPPFNPGNSDVSAARKRFK